MLQIVSDVNSMRSKRSQVRVCAYLLCDVFFLRFNTRALQRAIWSKFLDRNLFLVASFFFLGGCFEIFESLSCILLLYVMMILLINKNSAISEKILHLSFLLSLF